MLDVREWWSDADMVRRVTDEIEAATMTAPVSSTSEKIGRILATVEAQTGRMEDIQDRAAEDRQHQQVMSGRLELLERSNIEQEHLMRAMAERIAILAADVRPLRELMLKAIGGATVVGVFGAIIWEWTKSWLK